MNEWSCIELTLHTVETKCLVRSTELLPVGYKIDGQMLETRLPINTQFCLYGFKYWNVSTEIISNPFSSLDSDLQIYH